MLLSDPRTTLALVPAALQIYEAVRLPFARGVVNNARKAGLMYEFNWPGLYDGAVKAGDTAEAREKAEREGLEELGEAVQELWQWQWKEKVEDQWAEVESKYSELVKSTARAESSGWMGRCVIM